MRIKDGVGAMKSEWAGSIDQQGASGTPLSEWRILGRGWTEELEKGEQIEEVPESDQMEKLHQRMRWLACRSEGSARFPGNAPVAMVMGKDVASAQKTWDHDDDCARRQ